LQSRTHFPIPSTGITALHVLLRENGVSENGVSPSTEESPPVSSASGGAVKSAESIRPALVWGKIGVVCAKAVRLVVPGKGSQWTVFVLPDCHNPNRLILPG